MSAYSCSASFGFLHCLIATDHDVVVERADAPVVPASRDCARAARLWGGVVPTYDRVVIECHDAAVTAAGLGHLGYSLRAIRRRVPGRTSPERRTGGHGHRYGDKELAAHGRDLALGLCRPGCLRRETLGLRW